MQPLSPQVKQSCVSQAASGSSLFCGIELQKSTLANKLRNPPVSGMERCFRKKRVLLCVLASPISWH